MNHKTVIKDIMRETHTTQTQLGTLLGVRQTAISNIIKRDDIYLSTYVRILDALGYKLTVTPKED